MDWCLQEAKNKKLKESDFWGGFVLDEMKIEVKTNNIGFLSFINHTIMLFFSIYL